MRETSPLRTCTVCGKTANTIDDLKLFKKDPRYKYGRCTRCKACDGYYRERQEQIILENLPKPICCHFCGKVIWKLTKTESDSLILHSLDKNHNNFSIDNKAPCHNKCHVHYHRLKRRMIGRNNPQWKGDENICSSSIRRRTLYRKKHGIKVDAI